MLFYFFNLLPYTISDKSDLSENMKLIIYTDGASRGNPGKASYGFSIKDGSGKLIFEDGKYIGITTNNFAEYSAVLNALEYIVKNLSAKPSEINFFMDSKLVVEQLSGRFKIKSPNLIPLIYKIKALETNLNNVSYRHVPRSLNKVADALANKALDDL